MPHLLAVRSLPTALFADEARTQSLPELPQSLYYVIPARGDTTPAGRGLLVNSLISRASSSGLESPDDFLLLTLTLAR